MSYINRNANVVLLFLVVLSLTVLVGATVYFQQNFSGINKEYNEKLAHLEEMEKQLNQKSAALNKTREELVLKSERETEFTEQYTKEKEDKESAQKENEKLNSQVSSLDSQLDSAQRTLKDAQAELTFERRQNAELTVINGQLAAKVELYKSESNTWKERALACEAG